MELAEKSVTTRQGKDKVELGGKRAELNGSGSEKGAGGGCGNGRFDGRGDDDDDDDGGRDYLREARA